MSLDLKFVELTADVLGIFFVKYGADLNNGCALRVILPKYMNKLRFVTGSIAPWNKHVG